MVLTRQDPSEYSEEFDSNIVLPIKRDDLGEFIANLLGQQQTIEREIELPFDIDHKWLLNLHELIQQRVHQQANANLVSFKVVISFKDGFRRTLSTPEAFSTYNETTNKIPVGIKILWSFLVQFPHSSYPEKQQISFSAQINNTDSDTKEFGQKDTKNDNFNVQRPVIHLQIDHTERTWGDDLESIISSQVEKVLRTAKRTTEIYNIARLLLALFIAISGMVYSMTLVTGDYDANTNDIIKKYTESLSQAPERVDLTPLKVDTILELQTAWALREEHFVEFFLVLLGSVFFSGIVLIFTKKYKTSFLLLSQSSYEAKNKSLKKEQRSTYIFILSFAISVLAGILANYGYAWLLG